MYDHLRPVLAQPEQLGHLHLKGDVATDVVQQLVIGRVDCGRLLFGPGRQDCRMSTLTTMEVMVMMVRLPVVHPHDDVLHALVAINRKGRVILYIFMSVFCGLTKITICQNKTPQPLKCFWGPPAT